MLVSKVFTKSDLEIVKARQQAPVYLSPMDEYDEVKNQANRARVAELAIRHGYYAGLQMHKFFGVE